MNACVLCLLLFAAAPALAAGSGYAYVSSEKDHAITLVDLKTLAVAGTVPTCKRPRHMQARGDRLVVACSDSGSADLIDLATRRSVGRVALGDDPEVFDLSPDGRTAYVSAEDDAALNVFDLAGGRLRGSVPLGQEPEGVKVSPDGRFVYVTSEVAGLVHVVDAATLKLVKNIPVGQRPRRLAFAAGGSELWVTNELGSSVSVISLPALAVVATVVFEVPGMRPDDITPVGLVPSRDGRTMYLSLGRANHVAFVDVASRKTLQRVLVGRRAWGLALNRDGSRLFVVNGLSDDLTVIDTAQARALKTVAVGRVPHTVVVDD